MLGGDFKLYQAREGEEGRKQERERMKGRKKLKGKRRSEKGGKGKEILDNGTGPTLLSWIKPHRRADSGVGKTVRIANGTAWAGISGWSRFCRNDVSHLKKLGQGPANLDMIQAKKNI